MLAAAVTTALIFNRPPECTHATTFAHELAAGSDVVKVVAPNVVLVAHWKRLRDGELYAVTPRLE